MSSWIKVLCIQKKKLSISYQYVTEPNNELVQKFIYCLIFAFVMSVEYQYPVGVVILLLILCIHTMHSGLCNDPTLACTNVGWVSELAHTPV